MSTDKLKEIIAYSENKGPYGILAAIVAAIMALAQLSPDQLQRLHDFWPMMQSPAGILLLSTPVLWSLKIIFLDKIGAYIVRWVEAYLQEQATRTMVEAKIHDKLEKLAKQFEEMLAHHWDDRRYFDEQLDHFRIRFDGLDEKCVTIWKTIEKRGQAVIHGDTEKFSTLHPTQ